MYCDFLETKSIDATTFMSHSWATQGNAFVLFPLQEVLCILQHSTQNITPASNKPLVSCAHLKFITKRHHSTRYILNTPLQALINL